MRGPIIRNRANELAGWLAHTLAQQRDDGAAAATTAVVVVVVAVCRQRWQRNPRLRV